MKIFKYDMEESRLFKMYQHIAFIHYMFLKSGFLLAWNNLKSFAMILKYKFCKF